MIPGNQLSQADNSAAFVSRVRSPSELLVDYEIGGVGISDPSQGLLVKQWTARYEDGRVLLSADDVPETVLFSRPGITEIALAFDTNMAPFIAFQDAGGVAYWWFDPSQSQHVISPYLPAGCNSPRCTLDDKRYLTDATRDIILAYLRDGALYYRQQRDNYGIERQLDPGPFVSLVAVGMNRKNSLQFLAMEGI